MATRRRFIYAMKMLTAMMATIIIMASTIIVIMMMMVDDYNDLDNTNDNERYKT